MGMTIGLGRIYAKSWFWPMNIYFLSKWFETNCQIWHKKVSVGLCQWIPIFLCLYFQFKIQQRNNILLCYKWIEAKNPQASGAQDIQRERVLKCFFINARLCCEYGQFKS